MTIKNLISQGKIAEVIALLSDRNELTMIASRFNQNESDQRKGVIGLSDYRLELNRITSSLLFTVSELGLLDMSVDLANTDKPTPPQHLTHNESKVTGDGNFVIQGLHNSTISIGGKHQNQSVEEDKTPPKTILFLAANPSNEARIATDQEYRLIKAELERGRHRDQYQFLLPQFGVTIEELLRAMNDKPTIVHFAGHGVGSPKTPTTDDDRAFKFPNADTSPPASGIIVANDDNTHQLVSTEVLSRIFKRTKDHTKIVILNACYSAEQAKTISALGMYVIGYNMPINDQAAIQFAKGLYLGFSEGKEVQDAFDDAIILVMNKFPSAVSLVEVWKDGEQLSW